jgi:hypothetical protein
VARAEAEQEATRAILESAGTELGVALADTLNILDIDTVLLGGSFALLSAWLRPAVKDEIDQRVLTTAWCPVTVRPALLGPDAAAVGAALTAIDDIRQLPRVAGTPPVPGPMTSVARRMNPAGDIGGSGVRAGSWRGRSSESSGLRSPVA